MASKQQETKNLTREDLRALAPGEAKTFTMPNIQACYCGKSLAYQTQHLLNCKFSVSVDYSKNTLTIQRNEL